MSEWSPPAEFDGYRLIRPLGRGGMGRVFLGEDVLLARPVAVKFIAGVDTEAGQRERFFAEGRAIARLSHPNVMAVYRVGEVQGHPYLVGEFVRGHGLDALPKPMPWDRVLHIGMGLARGLAAAHRHGVLHRDIKPSNVVVAESGEVKLLDFGLAKVVLSAGDRAVDGGTRMLGASTVSLEGRGLNSVITRGGGLMGTPRYMAPEALRGEVATRRSDLFSLGAVLFELCSGKPLERGVDDSCPPLVGTPGIHPPLAEVIDRCLAPDPFRRFASADELVDALDHVLPERREVTLPEGNPYRGLRTFEAEHRGLFFGRETEIRVLLERLRSDRRVIVAGDSGVGKSSLCRAGVLPVVSDGGLGAEHAWRIVTLVPGPNPLAALATALAPVLELNEEALQAWVAQEPAAFARALQRVRQHRPNLGLLVFVDQAEELFTLASPTDATLAAEALGALESAPTARLLLAVRGDFVTRLASLPGIGEDVGASLYLLRPLSPERLREVIVEPARARGFVFESDELVEQLVRSAQAAPGALPLLQFALAELWEARNVERRVVPASALEAVGGVEGGLARHADTIVLGLLPEQRVEARRILVRLVTAEGTRIRRTPRELGALAGPAQIALDALVHGRLVVARDHEGETAYELAHEALAQGWGTLRDWLEEAAEERRIGERLEVAASEWERLGSSPDALWHPRQLVEASKIDPSQLGQREQAFLSASRRAARRRRMFRAATLASGPLVFALSLFITQLQSRQRLAGQVAVQLASARSELVKAQGAARESENQEAAAFELYDLDPRSHAMGPGEGSVWDRAERQWESVRTKQAEAEQAYTRASQRIEAALLIDPSRRDAVDLLAATLFARLRLAESTGRQGVANELRDKLSVYDREKRYARELQAPGTLLVRVDPAEARALLEEYRPRHGQLVPTALETLQGASEYRRTLPAGSYRITLTAAGYRPVRFPFLLERGEQLETELRLLAVERIPAGFVQVPAGHYLTGVQGDEDIRRVLGAVPLHRASTKAFLIQENEVTFADWIAYLHSLPTSERPSLLPSVERAQGALRLEQSGTSWLFRMKPSSIEYVARSGRPVSYADRTSNVVQDWRRFPVLGVTSKKAVSYSSWLAKRTGLATRLCTEAEWEHAARGADGRSFTIGDRVEPTEANFDLTYGRRSGGVGPDEIGTHLASDSPFGVHDMQGNAAEMVTSLHDDAELLEKGGSWYLALPLDGHLGARIAIEAETRSTTLGFRLCADTH